MTNKEKYAEWLTEHEDNFICGDWLAVLKETGEPAMCSSTKCSECVFLLQNDVLCKDEIRKWLYEDADAVDWDKVPVDTKIEVSSDGKNWIKRYFAKFENRCVWAWEGGGTSFSVHHMIPWDYARLYKELV